MSHTKILGSVMVAVLAAGSGCGTMANMERRNRPLMGRMLPGDPHPFGGVSQDVQWISSGGIAGALWFAADLPLSLVGDLVTLPITLRKKPVTSPPHRSMDNTPPLVDSPAGPEPTPNGLPL